jgi:hypothetical protein
MNPSRVLCSSLLGPEANRAIRVGNWKLVAKGTDGPWELYDLTKDRSELHNLAAEQPDRVKDLTEKWQHWAEQSLVFPLNPFKNAQQEEHAGLRAWRARLPPSRVWPTTAQLGRSLALQQHSGRAEKGVTLIYLRAAQKKGSP